jgi:peptidoglycan/xylan/chitin deacetylase (PgdA/CDA1 family)
VTTAVSNQRPQGRAEPSRYAVRSASALVVVAALAVPVMLGARWWPSSVSAQRSTPPAVLQPDDLAVYTEFARSDPPSTAPVVISYHDIRPEVAPDQPYVVTPTLFEEQMSMLEAAGYTSITAAQMAGYLNGEPVPPRSVWITFDDGTKGVWQWADPILERHDFTATEFIITGSVGERQPYYLTWAELREMNESGRWDLEAHTDAGHVHVRANASGSESGPFLLTRAWLDDQARKETVDEWRARVENDLDTCIQEFEDHGLPHPMFFAHPFAAVDDSSDPSLPPLLDQMIDDRFVASVANEFHATTVGQGQIVNRHILRAAVRGDTSTRDLFERLRSLDDGLAT